MALRWGIPTVDAFLDLVSPDEFAELAAAQYIEDKLMRPEIFQAQEETETRELTPQMAEAKAKAKYG